MVILNCNNISQYYSFYNLGEPKRLLSKTLKKILNIPHFETCT